MPTSAETIRQQLVEMTADQGITDAIGALDALYNAHQDTEEGLKLAAIHADILKAGLEAKEEGYIRKSAMVLEWHEHEVGTLPESTLPIAASVIETAIEENSDQALYEAYDTLYFMFEAYDNDTVRPHALRLFNAAQQHVTPYGVTTLCLCHDVLGWLDSDPVMLDATYTQYINNVVALNNPQNNNEAMEKLISFIDLQASKNEQKKEALYIAPLAIKIMDKATEKPFDDDNKAALFSGIEMMNDYGLKDHPEYAKKYTKYETILPAAVRKKTVDQKIEQHASKDQYKP